MSKKKSAKKSFIVEMICTVRKSVVVENCTEEEARNSLFEFAVEEIETDQIDWEVRSVKETQ